MNNLQLTLIVFIVVYGILYGFSNIFNLIRYSGNPYYVIRQSLLGKVLDILFLCAILFFIIKPFWI